MDYSQFRSTPGQGSAVGVNHRALITRALTKYPVDYALFRELLQNSADAQSNCAVIQFETSRESIAGSQLHDAPITRLRFTNDGLDFAKDDWGRLREIASGNPNETKIGAFGVGFYSVFELTDEPLVHSGNQIMAFKYHGVQLHYYFSEKTSTYQKGTLIDLPYREPQAMPDLVKFVGFLIQSFMLVNLNEIRLEIKHGGTKVSKLLHLKKKAGKPQSLSMPRSFKPKSPNHTLSMAKLQSRKIHVTIEYLNSTQMPPPSMSEGFFSFGKQLVNSLITTSTNPDEFTQVDYNFTKADAFVDVNVSSSFRKKMIETLLKPPPKQAIMSLISFSGAQSLPKKSQLTSYVFPDDYNDAKIFIGFATKQSTGLKSHLALNQVIPTMERTAADMSNQFVKDWNTEMLYMGGVMARCVYESELSNFQARGSEGMEDAMFVCSRFRFGKSAPDAVIGLYVREGFWKCSTETLVPSTQGILPSSQVRLAGDAGEVLRSTPIVMDDALAEELEKLKYVQTVTLSDVCSDVAASALTREAFIKVVTWLVKKWPQLNAASQSKLLTATTVAYNDLQAFNLGSVDWYHDRTLYPEEELASTLPPRCLPYDLANSVGIQNLNLLGIRSLRLPIWIESRLGFLSASESSSATKTAQAILHVTGRTWPRLSTAQRQEATRLLNSVRCIPTQKGLKFPAETYTQEIKLFPNLPVVSPNVDVSRIWLAEIGLRQSMDMEFVLHALDTRELNWSNEDLVHYLYDNKGMLKSADWNVLRQGTFFKLSGDDKRLHRANELYAPQSELMRLGLPTLKFSGWSDSSQQASLLFKIGLRRFPSAAVLFQSSNKEAALHYFVTHFDEAKYSPRDIADLEVVPTTERGVYSKPSNCYRDLELLSFGDKVIATKWEAFAGRLGVRERPPLHTLLRRVLQDPKKYLSSREQSNSIFTFFSKYTGEVSEEDMRLCRNTPFIPVFGEKQTVTLWGKPSDVFFPPTETDKGEDILRPLLVSIHPSRSAIPFLHLVGVSDKPSLTQTIAKMIEDPVRVFEVIESVEVYKEILISIDAHWSKVARHPQLVEKMKRAPLLLGIKYGDKGKSDTQQGQISLYSASELAIVDDVIVFNQFREHVITAPQEDALERLYSRLGVRYLSQTLTERLKIGEKILDVDTSAYFESRINERLRLFLENTSKQTKEELRKITVTLVKSLQLQRDLPPYASIAVFKSAFMSPSVPRTLLVVPGDKFEWIDVAVALSKAYLMKPDQDSFIVLETQLSSDLSSLEKKGYNVERLRNQGLEKHRRIAPKLEFKDDHETETGARINSEALPVSAQASASEHKPLVPQRNEMPGAWPWSFLNNNSASKGVDSKPAPQEDVSRAKTPTAVQALDQPQQSQELQARHNPSQPRNIFTQVKNLIPQALVPTSSQSVQQQLSSALRKGLAYNASELHGPRHEDVPSPVSEGSCTGNRKIMDLQRLGSLENGILLFATRENPRPKQSELLLSETLILLCSLFGYSPRAVHIYRDSDTSTIAFNQNGSLFFNSCVDPGMPTIIDYYYPVMAHELAHNLVASHGASHSFYTEAYIQTSIAAFAARREGI